MKKRISAALFVAAAFAVFPMGCSCPEEAVLAPAPPMGWNSYDSYGMYINEEQALANLEAFNEKLKPAGYEYFVIDSGWFIEYDPAVDGYFDKDALLKKVHINEFGLLQPSRTFFPNGLQPIIDRCHELGIKFGIHLMRGIPKCAVDADLPVKGTDYTASDIADLRDTCTWSSLNYGIDVSRPGGQEFYDALVGQLAEWGVDFIKYDDIVPHPDEVEAVVKAIEKSGRPIVLSLSPGDEVPAEGLEFFKKADMLRVTGDVWDNQKDIDKCFDAWKKWQGVAEKGFWIDMDMIPFGMLQVNCPKPDAATGEESKAEVRKKIIAGEFGYVYPYCGTGWKRHSLLTEAQMRTFITMRAMSASPMMAGGDLPTIDDYSLSLLTDKDIVNCNQTGVMGVLIAENGDCEVWKTAGTPESGWIGIFNRGEAPASVDLGSLDPEMDDETLCYDVFGKRELALGESLSVEAGDVIFIRYSMN